jgi:hypothetical protein
MAAPALAIRRALIAEAMLMLPGGKLVAQPRLVVPGLRVAMPPAPTQPTVVPQPSLIVPSMQLGAAAPVVWRPWNIYNFNSPFSYWGPLFPGRYLAWTLASDFFMPTGSLALNDTNGAVVAPSQKRVTGVDDPAPQIEAPAAAAPAADDAAPPDPAPDP